LVTWERASGTRWPPSQLTINSFPLKTTYSSQERHSTGITFHSCHSPHHSCLHYLSPTPSQGVDFPHKSLTSAKQPQLSSFSSAFTRLFTTLGTLWQPGTVSWGSVGFLGVQPHWQDAPEACCPAKCKHSLLSNYRGWRGEVQI